MSLAPPDRRDDGARPFSLAMSIAALALGAFAMGASVLFVRLADVGPFASAFWRAALAVPPLLAWALLSEGRNALKPDRASVAAGAFFAGDLFFWHLAILGTTVANAAVLATTSPLWVAAFAVLALRQRLSGATALGLALCTAGAIILLGRSWRFEPAHLPGDAAGLVTALFFAAYFLAVARARKARGAAAVTLISTVITALVLLVVALALEPTLLPASARGVAALVALALVSQVAGQGLLAAGLAVVPAVFGSLVLFLEVVSAAALGWLLLDEPLSGLQALGGAVILLGLFVARPRGTADRPDPAPIGGQNGGGPPPGH